MLNHIVLMGRLTRDPELRHTGIGLAVASFSLAVDRDYKGQSGEKETDFVDIVTWRSTADFVSKYFTKGRMAVVEGRLQLRDWKDMNTLSAARRLRPQSTLGQKVLSRRSILRPCLPPMWPRWCMRDGSM